MKNRLPLILNILLVFVAIATMFYGVYMLRNLQNSLTSLQQRKPDLEFILLKDIALSVIFLEDEATSFRYSQDITHLKNIEETTQEVVYLLDSLQELNNSDKILVQSSDSLKSLFERYAGLLGTYAEVSSIMINPDYDKIEEAVKKEEKAIQSSIPKDSVRIDTIQVVDNQIEKDTIDEKVGFFKRLFGRKKEEREIALQVRDSIIIDSVSYYANTARGNSYGSDLRDIESVIESLRREYSIQTKESLEREAELSKELSQIQLSIYEYLTFVESREVTKTKLEAVQAESQLADTRKQVSQFSFVTGTLVFFVFLGLIVFLQQNQRFQKLLMLARKRAEEYALSKQLFLANMSHEIRTPMNAIVGFTEQLRKTDLDPQQSEKVDIIHYSSDHLLHLLNDILDLSKFQTNTIKLSEQVFNVRDLINGTVKLLKIKAEEKGLKLHSNLENLGHEYLVSDPYRIKQVVINLVSNAIKFTMAGIVEVIVRVEKEDKKQKGKLILIVSDTGVGIPENKRDTVFRAFEQLETEEKTSGSGLGLSIVKHIIDLNNGTIDLRSEVNQGTRITISIPVAISSGSMFKSELDELSETDMLNGMKILIADDEPFNRKLLTEILVQNNPDLTQLDNGEEALELLSAVHFDIVFLDINMPGKKGHEVVKAFKRRNKKGPRPLFIAVTATTDEDQVDLSDFDGMIRKPYREQDVFEALGKYYKSSEPSHSEPEVLSIGSLAEIGDKAFVEEMLQTFLTSTRGHIDDVHSSISEKNYALTAELIHKIVGPARHLEAHAFLRVLKRLEQKARKDLDITAEDMMVLKEEFNILRAAIETHLAEQ